MDGKSSPEETNDLWVVGVGASAGGLEALSQFLHGLPEAPGHAAFIIAQHLAPHAKSMLVELLRKQTKLPIAAAVDRMPLRAGAILIVPPNVDATVSRGHLRLRPAGEATRPKPSVDTLFISIAESYGRCAVGIVLSGTGSDGAEGVRAIKEAGGYVIAQDSDSAKYDGMPKASLDTGLVDASCPPGEVGRTIYELLQRHAHPKPDAPAEYSPAEQVNIRDILVYLRKESGHDFTQYKPSTVQRRIEKRMAHTGHSSLNEYFEALKKDRAEVSSLGQEMLVSVTSFFRDPEAFRVLEQQLETLVAKKPAGEELRVWVAGCATGEEAYSVLFALRTICRRQGRDLPLKIFASDLDQEALAQARSGLYDEGDLASLAEEFRREFFVPNGRFAEVKKPFREMIVFARQDLVQSPPFVRLDLITCRNVLIYFEPKLQARLFEIFQYSLRPQGILFLGKSETAAPDLFETVDRQAKVFRRREVLSRGLPLGGFQTPAYDGVAATRRRVGANGPSLAELAPLQLAKAFGLVGAVIDETAAIQHIVGNLQSFAAFPGGQADFRLSNLLPKSAGLELMSLIRKTAKDGQPHKSHLHRVGEGEASKRFEMCLRTLEGLSSNERVLYLVSFESKEEPERSEPTHGVLPPGDLADRVIELEQEVTATREHLQTVVEELEISNEEMQSLNEELSSTNEELQASNEELETTNEELQATNEELTTLNEELNTKSAELRMANSNMENILGSIDAPVIVVDNEMRLLRYNTSSTQIFAVSPADYGEVITQVSSQSEIEDFEEKVKETIRTGQVSEGMCRTARRVFQMRIHPNRDENRRISGAVLVFFDNTDLLAAEEHLRKSDANIRAVIDGSPSFISLKDAMGRYQLVNRAFLELHDLSEREVLGRADRELFPDSLANHVRDQDLEVLLRRQSTAREERFMIRGQERVFYTSRFPLFNPGDKNPNAVGTVSHDITQQVRAESDLRESQSRYKAIVEDQAVFVCRHLPGGALNFTNASFCSYFGGSPESNTNRDFLSVVDSADQKRVAAQLAKLTPEHPIAQYEHRVKHLGTGPARWVLWIHRALFEESGAAKEFQAVGFDVTEIHNQTADLLKKENLFTQVLEHTSDIVTVYRVEEDRFLLESFNQSAADSNSFSQARLIGKNLAELVDPARAGEVSERYGECARTGRVLTFEEQSDAPGGTRFLSTTLVPIRDPQGRVERITALSRDITRLKRAESAIREEKKNAENANRAKSDFLAAISHELRTPLNVITGICYLMQREELKPNQQRLIDSVQRASKVLLSLIDDVLDLSKIEAGKVTIESQPFAPETLIKDIATAFEPQASAKGIKFELHAEFGEQTNLLGDSSRLRQVLTNLVGNAIKFTEKGGVVVRGRVTKRENEGGLVRLRFEVKDSGVGIPEESFPRIFQRFSQAESGTSRRFGGTGLGLAISKQLVELMSGEIGFSSEHGQGSTFWFEVRVPEASAKAPAQGAEAFPEDEEASLKDLRVLAVDDTAESLKVLKLALEKDCREVITVGSGQDALRVLRERAVDLVLLDVQMPDMDGFETTRRIRAMGGAFKKIPILALTANAMSGDEARCREAGMDDYLTKPIDFPKLRHKMIHWKGRA